MKYIKKFESFKINEEFIGMDFSKMKEAIKEIAEAFENEIFPNLSEEEKKSLIESAKRFSEKHGIKTGEELLNKIESDFKSNSDKVEQLSESMINEGFWQELKTSFQSGWKKFLSRMGAIFGTMTFISGVVAWAADQKSFVEWGKIATSLHDICRDILGVHSGPIGMLMMLAGVLLFIFSMNYGMGDKKPMGLK